MTHQWRLCCWVPDAHTHRRHHYFISFNFHLFIVHNFAIFFSFENLFLLSSVHTRSAHTHTARVAAAAAVCMKFALVNLCTAIAVIDCLMKNGLLRAQRKPERERKRNPIKMRSTTVSGVRSQRYRATAFFNPLTKWIYSRLEASATQFFFLLGRVVVQ